MTRKLTETQLFILVSHAGDWAKWADQFSVWSDDKTVTFIEAHMLVLALTHLEGCLKEIRGMSKPLDEAAEAFLQAMRDGGIRDARNLLEHEEQYLVGRGKIPALVGPGNSWPVTPDEASWSTGLMGSDRLETVTILGKTATLGPALDCIPEIHSALQVWLIGFRGW